MLNRVLTIGIALFWTAMMARLVQREIMPAIETLREVSGGASYRRLEELAREPHATQMGIYLGPRRIGYSLSRILLAGEELRIESRTELKLSLAPDGAAGGVAGLGTLDMATHFHARVIGGELMDFRLTVNTPPGTPPLVTVDGAPIGKSLQLRIRQGGETRVERIPFDARQLISSGLAQAIVPGRLRVGARWPIRTLDPLSRAVRVSTAEVVGTETIEIRGQEVEAFVIKVAHGNTEMTVWAGEDGDVLKQQVFGFTFIREAAPPDALTRRSL